MSTLPQVARCMQTVLTDEADAAGRRSGFIQRQVKLTGGTFAQTLVFGWLSNPEATLEELAQTAAVLGVQITPQGLDERFTPEAAQCLQQVLEAGLQQLVADEPVALPLLERFNGVYVQDSSTIPLPDELASIWRGCGGRTEQRTQSSLKIQLRLNLTTGQLQGPALQAGRGSDRRSPLPADDLPAGALWLADLGYFSLDCLADLDARGVYWLMRLQVQTAVLGATGQERDVLELLQAQGQDTVDIPVRLGKDRCLPCRLLARRVSPQEAEQRRRRLKAQARDKGRMVSARRLAWADWTIYITNVPTRLLTVCEGLVLGCLRWQIELLFKLWKSHGRIEVSRSRKPWRILCEVYAKLLAMLVQHWVLLVSCWRYADRSLPKAAKTVQRFALGLARAFGDAGQLCEVLGTIAGCVAQGCRMNKSRLHPRSYQLLLGVGA
jgi:hypothetical protein